MLQYVTSLSVLADGRLASGCNAEAVYIWNLGNGTCDRVLEGHIGVREATDDVYD